MIGVLFIFLLIIFYFAATYTEFEKYAKLYSQEIIVIEHKNQIIEGLQEKINRKNKIITDLKAEIEKRKATIADLKARAGKTDEKIKIFEDQIKKQEAEIKSLQNQLKEEKKDIQGLRKKLTGIREKFALVKTVRTKILKDIERRLNSNPTMNVKVDTEKGVVRLPEGKLFAKGEFVLSEDGRKNVERIASALKAALLCYSTSGKEDHRKRAEQECGNKKNKNYKVEAVFLEGHADSQPVRPNPRYKDNDELSTKRALSAFGVINGDDYLASLENADKQPLFGFSGYGSRRPICHEKTRTCYQQNRRIDLRLMMEIPKIDRSG